MQSNRTRYIALCALAGAALLVGVLGLLRWQDARLGRVLADQRLATVAAVQALVEQQRGADLRARGELIAGNQAFAAYVAQSLGGALPGLPVDTTSIVDLLEERRGQLDLSMAAVLDGQGRVVAATRQFASLDNWLAEPLFVQARDSVAAGSGLWAGGDRLLHVAVLPLAAVGTSDGYLLVAMPVDRSLAEAIALASGAEVALLRGTARGMTVETSTLAPEAEQALVATLADADARVVTPAVLDLQGQRYPTSVRPLLGSDNGQVLALIPPAPQAVLAEAAAMPWRVGSLALGLVLLLGAWLLWRRVLQPTDAVAQLLERAGSGDLRLQFPEENAGAMARLAAAFNALMQSLRSVS